MAKGVEEQHCLNAQTITETLVLTLFLKPLLGLGTLTERLMKIGCGCHEREIMKRSHFFRRIMWYKHTINRGRPSDFFFFFFDVGSSPYKPFPTPKCSSSNMK